MFESGAPITDQVGVAPAGLALVEVEEALARVWVRLLSCLEVKA